jgi:MFS family permease
MVTSINAGARLDRLPISSFHYRIFWLIAAGMFFDGYDLYIAGPVLGAAAATKFSTLAQNGWFLSLTFVGMTLGSLTASCHSNPIGVHCRIRLHRSRTLVISVPFAQRDPHPQVGPGVRIRFPPAASLSQQ